MIYYNFKIIQLFSHFRVQTTTLISLQISYLCGGELLQNSNLISPSLEKSTTSSTHKRRHLTY